MCDCCIFKEKTALICRWFIGFIVLWLIVIGVICLAIGGYTLSLSGVSLANQSEDSQLKSLIYYISIAAFIAGAFTIVLGLTGGLLIRCRNSWVGCPFIFFSYLIGILAIGTGITIVNPNTNGLYYLGCYYADE